MATKLPAKTNVGTKLPSSIRALQGIANNPLNPGGIVGPIVTGRGAGRNPQDFGDLPPAVRAAIGGPLGLLVGADLDLVDVLLRVGAAAVGVAFIIAGGFLIVKESQTTALARGLKGAVGRA